MEGDSSGKSTTPETTGSGRARGKRPEMEIINTDSEKTPFFLKKKKWCFELCLMIVVIL